MTNNRYREYLRSAQAGLLVEIERIRKSIPHAGEKGGLIEGTIRSSLARVLPEKLGISHGFVADSFGSISKQLDIVIFDRFNTPRLFASDAAQVFPVESTIACGEVKTCMGSSQLKDCFEKCTSYKKLQRNANAYIERSSTVKYKLFGEKNDYWRSIFFCISAEGINFHDNLISSFKEIVKSENLRYDLRIDTVISLLSEEDRANCLLNVNGPIIDGQPPDGSIDLLPTRQSNVGSYRANDPWALFVHLLLRCLTQVQSEPLNMLPYAGSDPF